SFGYFHDTLAPHGYWVNSGNYGPCWRPSRVASGWRPYYDNGHWVYTDYGWTWVSSDPWASTTYHYGSWYDDASYGWVWVPGYTWAPAWVTWSYTDNYVGWAPIPPSFRFYPTRVVNYQPVVVRQTDYIFVPTDRITEVNISRVRIPRERNMEI